MKAYLKSESSSAVPILAELLRLSIPTAISALIGLLVDLLITRILGVKNPENYYILSLYLPISYLLMAIMESSRASIIFLASSSQSNRTESSVGNKLILMMLYGILPIGLLLGIFNISFTLNHQLLDLRPHDLFLFKGFVNTVLLLFYIRYVSYIFVGALYGFGKTHLVMLFSVISAVLTLLLVSVFSEIIKPSIYAQIYALSISTFFIGLLAWLMLKKNAAFSAIKFNDFTNDFFPFFKKVFKFSAPIFASYLLIFLGLFFFNTIVSRFGVDVVSGFGVAYRIQTLIIIPAIALGIGVGIMINKKGNSNFNHFLRLSIFISTVFYFFMAVLVFFMKESIVSWIVPEHEIAQRSVQYLYYVAPSYIGMGPLLVFLTAMEQTGFGGKSLLLNFVYFLFIAVVGGLMSIQFNNVILLYKVMGLANFSCFIFIMYTIFYTKRKKNERKLITN